MLLTFFRVLGAGFVFQNVDFLTQSEWRCDHSWTELLYRLHASIKPPPLLHGPSYKPGNLTQTRNGYMPYKEFVEYK